TGKPNKTVYAITKQGLAHLHAWSRIPTERPPPRDNLLVKLYALDHVDLAALREEISMRLVRHKARLALYERIRTKRFSGRIKDLRRVGWRLGLDYGLMTERNQIAWCEAALVTLADYAGDKSPRRQRAS
ncbi:PadR family transcriptional regulator, partial [Herbaspirillum sp. HC18]